MNTNSAHQRGSNGRHGCPRSRRHALADSAETKDKTRHGRSKSCVVNRAPQSGVGEFDVDDICAQRTQTLTGGSSTGELFMRHNPTGRAHNHPNANANPTSSGDAESWMGG